MIQDRICRTPTCGKAFKGGPRAYYCHECRAERQRIQHADFKRRKRAGQVRSIGSTDVCKRCGGKYIVNAGAQQYCEDCQLIHKLEYDAATSITFYRENKEEINPVRNERRRIGLIPCVICGNEFDPEGTKRLTCCEDHAREYRNSWWMSNYYKSRNGEPLPEGALRMSDISRETGLPYSTINSRYQAGNISDPDGFTYVGDPYWFGLPEMKNTK